MLLRLAIVVGDDSSFEELAGFGGMAVIRFCEYLDGQFHLDLPGGWDRAFANNTASLSRRLAESFPGEYLSSFNSSRWITSSFVLSGLGCTGRDEVKPVLIEALFSSAPETTRLHAAIALGCFPGADSVSALIRALDDDEYLVKYHSVESLGRIGDKLALDRLLAIAGNPPSRGIAVVAPRAAATLAWRLGVVIEAPKPDLSQWDSPER